MHKHQGELDTPGKPVVTDEQVIVALSEVALGTAQYPVYDKSGEESLQAPPLTARLRALELLGKHLQLFSPGNKAVDKEEGGFVDDIPSESESL